VIEEKLDYVEQVYIEIKYTTGDSEDLNKVSLSSRFWSKVTWRLIKIGSYK